MNGGRAALTWCVTRVLCLSLLLFHPEQANLADIRTFRRWSYDLWHHGRLPRGGANWEYPIGAVLALVPGKGGPNDYADFFVAFVCLMLIADGLITAVLLRLRSGQAAWLWLALLPALGPLVYTRFDLLPAAAATLGLVAVSRRPLLSGIALGLGGLIKAWPLLLVPALLGHPRRAAVVSGAMLVLGVACLGLALTGHAELIGSPLQNQDGRGVQVEALPGVGHLVAFALGADVSVRYAHSSWELVGPGLGAVGVMATCAAVVGLLCVYTATANACRRDPQYGLAWGAATTIAVLLATDKVLSPQYLIWLLAPLCLLAAARPLPPSLIAALAVLFLATHVEYPILYNELLRGEILPAAVVVLRDIALLIVVHLLVRIRPKPDSGEVPRGPAATAHPASVGGRELV